MCTETLLCYRYVSISRIIITTLTHLRSPAITILARINGTSLASSFERSFGSANSRRRLHVLRVLLRDSLCVSCSTYLYQPRRRRRQMFLRYVLKALKRGGDASVAEPDERVDDALKRARRRQVVVRSIRVESLTCLRLPPQTFFHPNGRLRYPRHARRDDLVSWSRQCAGEIVSSLALFRSSAFVYLSPSFYTHPEIFASTEFVQGLALSTMRQVRVRRFE